MFIHYIVGFAMKKVGVIFPGQGSQFSGMCKELYDNERVIQGFFDEAASCLDTNFVKLCFASSDADLKQTRNAQTSIYVVSTAIYELITKKYGLVPYIVAGHSSGQYAALYAAGGLTFFDGLYLLDKRSQFMDEATRQHPGGMIAVLGITHGRLVEACREYDDPQKGLEQVVQVVNYNSQDQFVVSGTHDDLDVLARAVVKLGGKAIKLPVFGGISFAAHGASG